MLIDSYTMGDFVHSGGIKRCLWLSIKENVMETNTNLLVL